MHDTSCYGILIVARPVYYVEEEGSKRVTKVTGSKMGGVRTGRAGTFPGGRMRIEKISAVTLKVASMRKSVRFYKDVLGMEVLFGGEDAFFSSLRAKDASSPILNLEQGHSVPGWGRMIFYVADVDAFWEYLRGKGFNPESPRDASWGERYFHMADSDGHELSFARPI